MNTIIIMYLLSGTPDQCKIAHHNLEKAETQHKECVRTTGGYEYEFSICLDTLRVVAYNRCLVENHCAHYAKKCTAPITNG